MKTPQLVKKGRGSFSRLFSFLNLLGRDGKLSITNVAVYVALIKFALASGAASGELGALFLSLMNYAHKRKVVNDATQIPSP